jgi:phosphohistidine phosphatase
MDVYLVRHGIPVPGDKNPKKPLSNQGKKEVERVAVFMKEAGVTVQTVFHSGKTRARETAEIMAIELQPDGEIIEKKGLSPMDNVTAVAREIENSRGEIMIVGHLPHLGKLTSRLTHGNEAHPIVSFQPGSVLCLRRDTEKKSWVVAWMLTPEIIS